MSGNEKRGRGRPKGPSQRLLKTDQPVLVAAADVVLATKMAPTTAFRRVAPGIEDSHVRRLQQRWKDCGSQLLADAGARHASLQRARSGALAAVAAAASPWINPRVMAELLGNSPWNNPAVMEAVTGISVLKGHGAAAKMASFSHLGLLSVNPASYSAVAKAAAFDSLGLLNDLEKLPKLPFMSVLDTLGTTGSASKLMASLQLLDSVGTSSAIDAIMGRTRKRG